MNKFKSAKHSVRKSIQNIPDVFRTVVTSPRYIVASATIGVFFFILSIFFVTPLQSFGLITDGFFVFVLSRNYQVLLLDSGVVGVVLTVAYSWVSGIVITFALTDLNRHGFKASISALPAVLASGCVSCGAGIFGLFGAIGVGSILPFGGNLIRLVGLGVILLLSGLVYRDS